MKRILLLLLIVSLSVSPMFAQAQSQTARFAEVEAEGLTLNVDVPDGWSVRTNAESVYIASSDAAMDELMENGSVSSDDETGVVVYHPVFLRRVSLQSDAPSDRVLETYRRFVFAEGEIEASDTFSVPGSFGQFITNAGVELWALALEFPGGTTLVSISMGGDVDPALQGILQSITLTGGESAPAQQTEEAEGFTTTELAENGLTLSVSHPASWASTTTSGTLMLASSQAALDALSDTGIVDTAGDVGVIIYLPSMLRNLQLAPDADPEEAVTKYLATGGIESNVQALDALQVPGAAAMITMPTNEDVQALIGALKFPAGTIIFGVVPGNSENDAMGAILRSITLSDGSEETPLSSVEIVLGETPTTFDVPNPGGRALPLSINLPDGWASRYSENAGFIYVGTSEGVVNRIASNEAGLEAGEIGITIVVPEALQGLGIGATDTPEQAIQQFETRFQATGTIFSDDSFGVPAAYANVSGASIPDGGGVVYVLGFDAGTILAVIQPASAANESVVNLLRSIQFGAAAEPIRQWASSADGSSEYGEERWGFEQATGEPDTAACGDQDTAWAGESSSGREYLRVFFDEPVIPSQINVYQTYNPGAIVQIDVGVSETDRVLPLPDSADPAGNTECPGVYSYDVSGVTTPIDFVVIYVDQSLTGDWNEIDAVELVGTPAG